MNRLEFASASSPVPHIPFPANGSYPLRHGNRVRPLVDGVPALRRIGEAIDTARHSVWITAAFALPTFALPDGRGTLLDVLDRAAARGLDVRILFWRPHPESRDHALTFAGTAGDHAMLGARDSRFRARWDGNHGRYCQHQKSWLIDAGQPTATAFVGGVNLTPGNLGMPGHLEGDLRHDACVEITGPSVTDVHHNFVQRWNEASERTRADGVWGHRGDDDLAFPTLVCAPQGDSLVHIQRMVHAGRYSDGQPTPGGEPYDIAGGERSVFEQYLQAIAAARHSIYIENQAVPILEIANGLELALQRGVEVIALVPAQPPAYMRDARRDPARKPLFDQITALARYDNFALVGIAAQNPQGGRSDIYVHGKIMLIDDAFATIGSCNLHAYSMFGHTEMNATFWDPAVVRAFRCQLLAEHLDRDTSHLDDCAALRLYRNIADRNRRKAGAGDASWEGLAFSLDAASYAA